MDMENKSNIELRPWHHKRELIIKENLLQYSSFLKISDCDKNVIREYVNGASYKELGEKYHFAPNRVPQIAFHYIRHCGLYLKSAGIYADREQCKKQSELQRQLSKIEEMRRSGMRKYADKLESELYRD